MAGTVKGFTEVWKGLCAVCHTIRNIHKSLCVLGHIALTIPLWFTSLYIKKLKSSIHGMTLQKSRQQAKIQILVCLKAMSQIQVSLFTLFLTGQHHHQVMGNRRNQGVDTGGTAMIKEFVTKQCVAENREDYFRGRSDS